ncbi:MAG TPA: hypothetical protein VL738_19960 [Dactylosporangium sp.]|nr:hypothetical protein [Dactylosporangium sp.]
MNDLELQLREGFGERAERPVDTVALLDAAVRQGRRRRGLSYALRAGGAAAAIGAVIAGAALLPGVGADRAALPGAPEPDPQLSAAQSWRGTDPPPADGAAPALPPAAGVRGAADAPGAVGADPAVLHFTIDPARLRAAYLTWESGDGLESVAMNRADGTVYRVSVATTAGTLDAVRDSELFTPKADWSGATTTATSVAGRPATLSVAGKQLLLRWQPVDGLWAQAQGFGTAPDQAALAATAAGLRLDKAFRCALPLHLVSLPAGSRPVSCVLVLRGYDANDALGRSNPVSRARLGIADGDKWAWFELSPVVPAPKGSHGAALQPQVSLPPGVLPEGNGSDYSRSFHVDGYDVDVASKGYAKEQMEAAVAGMSVRPGDWRDTATWPERIVG